MVKITFRDEEVHNYDFFHNNGSVKYHRKGTMRKIFK
jgi:hypothetical protein